MMFDVNSNGSPNEKGSDIRLVNAGGIGSAPKKCVGETSYAFVVPEGGVDCTNIANAADCRIIPGKIMLQKWVMMLQLVHIIIMITKWLQLH